MSDNNDQIDVKMILLGESGVGKTSIISRYVNDKFNENFVSSSTMSYVAKIIEKGKKKIKLNIWDTIGQEKFRSISKLFLNDTKIVILVYDITLEESFKNLYYWLKLYKDILGEGIIVGVAANKSDLFLKQEVSDDVGREYAEKNGAIFSLVSAKANKLGLDKFIDQLVDAYLNKGTPNTNNNDNNTIKLNNKNDFNARNNNSGGCCSGGNKKIKQKKYEYIVKNRNGCINSVFLGDKGVGKTSIINRIEGKEVNINEEHTEENNKIKIDYNSNQMKLKIIINDVDNDKMKTKEFVDIIKESNIFFLIYDVNYKQSLDNVGFWNQVIKRCKEDNKKENYLLYVIGNKNDISHEGDINKEEENQIISNNDKNNKKYIEEGRELSNNIKGMFKVVSALENKGIDNILGESIENYLSLK